MILTIFLAAAALLAAAVWHRSHRPSVARVAARTPERFAAVEIRRRSGACEAAHALDGQRFLANQSPALPLVGCTKTRCDCRFVKLTDRRADDRRWGLAGLGTALFAEPDRRQHGERREEG